jgi:diphthamide biosynthesis protein 3
MAAFYDEVELEDFTFDSEDHIYYYPCPCGDRFQITEAELEDGEEIARCPSCSLMLRVIYNHENGKIGQYQPDGVAVAS